MVESDQVGMDMWVTLGVLLALLFGVAAIAVRYSLGQYQKIVTQFRLLGEKFDLELTVPKTTMLGLYRRNPTLYGRYQGHELSVFPKGYGMDNTRQTDTAVRVSTRIDAALHITIARRNLSGKLGQMGRLKEVKTGDAAFDQEFSLRSNDGDAALRIFNDEQRALLTREWPKGESFFTLEDSTITQLRFGLIYEDSDREEVERIVAFCLELSDAL